MRTYRLKIDANLPMRTYRDAKWPLSFRSEHCKEIVAWHRGGGVATRRRRGYINEMMRMRSINHYFLTVSSIAEFL